MQIYVFEPRYRQMVADCVEQERPLAVAFGLTGVGTRPRSKQSLQELLNSNQETYQPAPVFGVGDVVIIARLPDGRFLIEVAIKHRGRLIDYVQEVPYLVAHVDVLPPDSKRDAAHDRLFDGLLMASDVLLGDKAAIFRTQLGDAVVRGRQLDQIVYPILQWFQVGAVATQSLLEEESDYDRGARLLAWMIRYMETTRKEEHRPVSDDVVDYILSLNRGLTQGSISPSLRRQTKDGKAKVLPFRKRRLCEHHSSNGLS